MRCVILAHPAVILVESDIKHPMQTVLDPPVATCCIGKRLSIRNALAADVKSAFPRNGAIDVPLPLNQTDTGKAGSVFTEFPVHPGQVGHPQRLSGLDSPMPFLDSLPVDARYWSPTCSTANC